jgi:hypothetical protein
VEPTPTDSESEAPNDDTPKDKPDGKPTERQQKLHTPNGDG